MTRDFPMGGSLKVTLTRSDLGKRVSVRRTLEVVEGREVFGDVVGILTSWDAGVLTITRRSGERVEVAEDTLVAGKVVPPAPARRRRPAAATAAELQQVAARGWPARETELLGGWTLRASGGFTRRANSVLPLGEPGMPLDQALLRITAWYAYRGLPAYVQVTTGAEGCDAALSADLAARGWTAEGHALLRTAPLPALTGAPGTERVQLSREAGESWLSRYHRTGSLGSVARSVIGGGPSVWFATVPAERPGDPPAAIGRCVVDGRWAGFAAIEVDPALRRGGLGSAVMAALAAQAGNEGADSAYLQVEADNGAAAALYDRMDFRTHHPYHYCRPPQED